MFILVLALASWMLFHTSWITWCCAVVIWLAGTCLVALNLLLVEDMGMMETSTITTSLLVAGCAGDGDRSAPILMGIPSFSRRRVPRWKGFSFLDLAMWAWKGPEM